MIRKLCGIPKDASWDGFMERFPILFQDRNKSCKETCMCWGIECPIGWYYILEQLCTILEFQNMRFSGAYGFAIIADQVKEKYGTLRFYFTVKEVDELGCPRPDGWDANDQSETKDKQKRIIADYLGMVASKYIREAEEMTEQTCADCGSHDDIITTKGWITYICKKCNDKREKARDKE